MGRRFESCSGSFSFFADFSASPRRECRTANAAQRMPHTNSRNIHFRRKNSLSFLNHYPLCRAHRSKRLRDGQSARLLVDLMRRMVLQSSTKNGDNASFMRAQNLRFLCAETEFEYSMLRFSGCAAAKKCVTRGT